MKRFARLASCVAASAVALSALTAPSADAYGLPVTESSQAAGDAFMQSTMLPWAGSMAITQGTPLYDVVAGGAFLSSLPATMIASISSEQCNLFDTRGCHHR